MHSLWSDGNDFSENIAAWFKEQGYNFIAFTEHDQFSIGNRWIEPRPEAIERFHKRWGGKLKLETNEQGSVLLRTLEECRVLFEEPGRFIILGGEETTVSWMRQWTQRDMHHQGCVSSFADGMHWINSINIDQAIPALTLEGSSSEAIAQTIQAVEERSYGREVLVSLNHPNYSWNARAEDIAAASDLGFMEIHTPLASCHCYGQGKRLGAERIWDIVLARRLANNGKIIYGLATDDSHNYFDLSDFPKGWLPGRAWIMVRAETLSGDAIVSSMKQGDFYASTGVTLAELSLTSKGIDIAVECEAGVNYDIYFIGTNHRFDQTSKPVLDENGKELFTTAVYSDQIGKTLKHTKGPQASYSFTGNELYVRALVLSDRPHHNPAVPGDTTKAWTQPTAKGSPQIR